MSVKKIIQNGIIQCPHFIEEETVKVRLTAWVPDIGQGQKQDLKSEGSWELMCLKLRKKFSTLILMVFSLYHLFPLKKLYLWWLGEVIISLRAILELKYNLKDISSVFIITDNKIPYMYIALKVYKNLHLPVPHKFPVVEANSFSPNCINGELQAKCISKTRERIMKQAAFSPFNLR